MPICEGFGFFSYDYIILHYVLPELLSNFVVEFRFCIKIIINLIIISWTVATSGQARIEEEQERERERGWRTLIKVIINRDIQRRLE